MLNKPVNEHNITLYELTFVKIVTVKGTKVMNGRSRWSHLFLHQLKTFSWILLQMLRNERHIRVGPSEESSSFSRSSKVVSKRITRSVGKLLEFLDAPPPSDSVSDSSSRPTRKQNTYFESLRLILSVVTGEIILIMMY